ncbi:hypothetical protein LCGC14_0757800 [marine sediment metagenome]|uniref:Uncharacterized protein n=1 Tax=marine sediment metagenome TaxID=412755 RepID=A0A0F9Q259_9ZZZZ
MKKYRARWDHWYWHNGKKCGEGSSWLTDDQHVHFTPSEAAVGTLGETVNRIAQMSLNEPGTVTNGVWVLERKRKGWVAVQ